MRHVIVMLVLAALANWASAAGDSAAEADVLAAATAFNLAYETNELDAYFGHYVPEAELYFYGQRVAVADYYAEWQRFLGAGGAVQEYAMSDVRVRLLTDDVAISSYFVVNRTRDESGEVARSEGFETVVWQQIDGRWRVLNLHFTEHGDS